MALNTCLHAITTLLTATATLLPLDLLTHNLQPHFIFCLVQRLKSDTVIDLPPGIWSPCPSKMAIKNGGRGLQIPGVKSIIVLNFRRCTKQKEVRAKKPALTLNMGVNGLKRRPMPSAPDSAPSASPRTEDESRRMLSYEEENSTDDIPTTKHLSYTAILCEHRRTRVISTPLR
ncbi:hypothetical protein J6590_058149 [Homalodisca vitripennis]|nr:hypothetical protein J6590_058149 [Homalodisca vitripennis]